MVRIAADPLFSHPNDVATINTYVVFSYYTVVLYSAGDHETIKSLLYEYMNLRDTKTVTRYLVIFWR